MTYRSRRTDLVPFAYTALLIAIYVGLLDRGYALAGELAACLLAVSVALRGPRAAGSAAPAARACVAVAAVAAIPAISLGLPLHDWSRSVATIIVTLLTVGVWWGASPAAGVTRASALSVTQVHSQAITLAWAIALGLIARLAGASAFSRHGTGGPMLGLAAGLASAVGVELLLRCLLQQALAAVTRRGALVAVCLLFPALEAGSVPAGELAVLGLAGILFAVNADRTGSGLGAIAAHIAFVLSAELVGPALLHPIAWPLAGYVVVAGVAVTTLVVVVLLTPRRDWITALATDVVVLQRTGSGAGSSASPVAPGSASSGAPRTAPTRMTVSYLVRCDAEGIPLAAWRAPGPPDTKGPDAAWAVARELTWATADPIEVDGPLGAAIDNLLTRAVEAARESAAA